MNKLFIIIILSLFACRASLNTTVALKTDSIDIISDTLETRSYNRLFEPSIFMELPKRTQRKLIKSNTKITKVDLKEEGKTDRAIEKTNRSVEKTNRTTVRSDNRRAIKTNPLRGMNKLVIGLIILIVVITLIVYGRRS